jgi:hypothetical protein
MRLLRTGVEASTSIGPPRWLAEDVVFHARRQRRRHERARVRVVLHHGSRRVEGQLPPAEKCIQSLWLLQWPPHFQPISAKAFTATPGSTTMPGRTLVRST